VNEIAETELTRYVSDWVVELELEAIPAEVRDRAVGHILDGYGLALAGATEASHHILMNRLLDAGGKAEAQILGVAARVPAEAAAFANGLSMHAMDFDDTQLSTSPETVYGLLTHPTAPVLAAAAAVADAVNAAGEDLLVSYLAGLEVACRVADALNPRHYMKGFHTSGTVGAIGGAVAVAKLLGLTPEQLRVALAIAAATGGGLRENFGTMTKPLHVGNAARAGVLAARLAADGFTAAESILEAPRGFFSAAAGGYEASRIVGKLGDPFYFSDPGVSIKPYPSGSLSHPGQDVAIALCVEHDVRPDQVETAVAVTNSATVNALLYPMPQTALEAKFSFPFGLAVAILRRRAGIAEYDDEFVRSPGVQEMMRRCRHVADEAIDARGFQDMETRIEIRLKDGTVLERTSKAALGHPARPMSKAQLEEKFFTCADLTIPRSQSTEAAALLWELASLPSVSQVHALLAPDGGQVGEPVAEGAVGA
jgi:2-methylcitrate dehydratase PrpD